MRKGRGKYKAFLSLETNKLLLVYRIDKGTKGNVSRFWKETYQYTARNCDLTGFYLFVLLNPNSKTIFHTELRYGVFAKQNLEYMRYENNLNWRLFPLPM
ncbi:hypothetical protein, partial [Vallitalea maricola]|uniref:hypothetical protein n=1 Tax=Vallitalea maricola TaxID=3074433 RepID=UPI0030D9C092